MCLILVSKIAEKWSLYDKIKLKKKLVLPSMNMGKSLDVVNQGHASTSGLIEALFRGNHEALKGAAQCMSNERFTNVLL